ncbi:MAG: insulinase family protein [Alicyclobacillus sp.]|nr:insulinase family protein [Alicyclobacillus sp.]
MREFRYDRVRHTVYAEQLDNGLSVYLLPKPGFQQVFAAFSTRYGSVDRTFRLAGEPEFTTVPDGIAHFLEHKMFESEQGDVFSSFAKHGASANAFTTFDQTTYLFSCTADVEENTGTLLDFVQSPYFTDQNVEKEKGIIGQEIRMYDDNPDWRAYFGLLKALYANHPVRIDIAGTVESIQQIDKDLLYRCYHTFYHPGNMIFVAVGGFDPGRLLDVILRNQAAKSFGPAPDIERSWPEEPEEAASRRSEAHLSVSQPRCLIGWKDRRSGLAGRPMMEQELLTGLILDALFGRSSPFYHALIDEGLIDQQFSWEYEVTPSYGHSLVGGNTPDPHRLAARVQEELERWVSNGIEEEAFERSRRKAMGRFVTSLDSPSHAGRTFTSYRLKDADWFDTLEVLESLTLAQAHERLRDHFADSQRAVSVVWPK